MNEDSSLLCHVNLANGFRGGERQTLLLIRALSERGFKQKLIARKDSELTKRCQSMGGLDVIESNIFGLNVFSKISEKSLFHFHDSRSFSFFYLHNLNKDLNYIYTRRVQRSPKMSFISKKIYKRARCIICLSSSIENSLKNSFGKDIASIIIPSASANFDYDSQKSLKIRQEIKQKFLVGHIGVLNDSHKGQLDIIELARKAKSRELDIGFVMVGSGRDESMLKKESNSLDNVYFAGQVENIGDYLDAFDVFIFPSRHEGLGSTLLDAIDFGLPIIARDVGGISDIIDDGVNGYLVGGDESDFFTPLIELYTSESIRNRISEVNRKQSDAFSIERMTESYISLYNQYL
tara:strand:- start:1312 stop:2358 length:1047 start_codon:yes stop_codon:yes gene_type:complete